MEGCLLVSSILNLPDSQIEEVISIILAKICLHKNDNRNNSIAAAQLIAEFVERNPKVWIL